RLPGGGGAPDRLPGRGTRPQDENPAGAAPGPLPRLHRVPPSAPSHHRSDPPPVGGRDSRAGEGAAARRLPPLAPGSRVMQAAWKFLAPGQVAPFGGVRWPAPDRSAPAPWFRPRAGEVFACRVVDLPWWLDAELWEVELEGPVSTLESQLVAPAGRLLRRVAAWDTSALHDYGAACARRARELAVQVLLEEGRASEAELLANPEGLLEMARVARALSAEASVRRGANLAGYVAESAT